MFLKVMLSITPLIIGAIVAQSKLLSRLIQATQKTTSEYNQVLIESVSGVRTIIGFVAENRFLLLFFKQTNRLYRLGVLTGHLTGGVTVSNLIKIDSAL